MKQSKYKKPVVLAVLFFLPVMFLLFLYPSKHNYMTLDIVKYDIPELTGFKTETGQPVKLENHLTVLGFLGETPMFDGILALNLKELIYDKFRGFKRFQVVILVPESARDQVAALKKELYQYEPLSYWVFGFGSDQAIKKVYNNLQTSTDLGPMLKSESVFIVDRERHQRGRLDDREKDEKKTNAPIYERNSYNCLEVAVLKNKMSEDLRILFTEYRQKRKGNFDSTSRRANDLKAKKVGVKIPKQTAESQVL